MVHCSKQLTIAEKEVLDMLSEEYLTPKKIAIRRKSTTQAVYRIRRNLRKKGVINLINKRVAKTLPTSNHFATLKKRLHAQEFNIRILYKDKRYQETRKKSNVINIDGNTIRLYKNTIELYSGQSFYADTVDKVTAKSFKYWNRLFARMEHDLKVLLVKSRSQNIRLVNHHYSEINNELARDIDVKVEKIRVYAEDDGKLWFLIDNSFNLHEAETVHPDTAQLDMRDTIVPFFNGLRSNKGFTPQFVLDVLGELVLDRKYYTENLRSHVKAVQQLGEGVGKLRKDVKNLNNRLSQKKLGGWI